MEVGPTGAPSGEVNTVVAPDGTSIGFRCVGGGRPLCLVHGSPADHTTFDDLVPHLASRLRTCAIDRRGRGMSGDGPDYAHEREFEDVAAVVDTLGPDAALLGHSYGGVVALEAARLAADLGHLVLYEPWIGRYPDGVIDELRHHAASGDREAVMTSIFRRLLGMTDDEIDRYRATPGWQARVAIADVHLREAIAEDAYEFDPSRFADLGVPTLLVVGGDSPPDMRSTIEMLDHVLPHSEVVEIPGHGHLAHRTAPGRLAELVLGFLR